MQMARVFGRANKDTFSCKPIKEFVQRYLEAAEVSIDPFARNKDWFTHTNDLNPETSAQHHMDAEEFLRLMSSQGVIADLGKETVAHTNSSCFRNIMRYNKSI